MSYFPFLKDFMELNIFNILSVISASNSFWKDLPMSLSDVKLFESVFISKFFFDLLYLYVYY